MIAHIYHKGCLCKITNDLNALKTLLYEIADKTSENKIEIATHNINNDIGIKQLAESYNHTLPFVEYNNQTYTLEEFRQWLNAL